MRSQNATIRIITNHVSKEHSEWVGKSLLLSVNSGTAVDLSDAA
jgi:hypothetical protein